jgi:hypothetical protein
MSNAPQTVTPSAREHGRRRHNDDRKGIAAMTEKINNIEQTELTSGERQVLAEDGKRWKRMGAGAHLEEWLAYGEGLMIRRRLAMKICHTNRPEGKCYTTMFGQLMQHDGMNWTDNTLKTSMTAVLWLNDDPERMTTLREIRETMTPGERARLNSPITARQRVEKILRARVGGTEETMRTAPMTILKKQVAEQNRTIADLQEQLAAAEARDGSLFDLKRDSTDNIVKTIIANATENRATTIARGILNHYKKQKPAG